MIFLASTDKTVFSVQVLSPTKTNVLDYRITVRSENYAKRNRNAAKVKISLIKFSDNVNSAEFLPELEKQYIPCQT